MELFRWRLAFNFKAIGEVDKKAKLDALKAPPIGTRYDAVQSKPRAVH